ncbi:hypothetical protein NDU88_002451 [Pleurodeles waltl]|uniref:RNase H type-1 domain-containing protein n=1 Tax=Pleurodeles waltl TaxID=8319 RepID=A0AAV7LPC2_PLEWA|nr:hypothetical protein NDU88_002451 [Pleurodeles waltl]
MARAGAARLTSKASIGAAQKKVIMEELSTSQSAESFLHSYGLEADVLDYDEGDEVEEGEIVQERDRKEEKVWDRMAFNGSKRVGVFQKKTGKTVQCDRRGGREERTMIMAHIPRGGRWLRVHMGLVYFSMIIGLPKVDQIPLVVALSLRGRTLAKRKVVVNVSNQTVVNLANFQKAKDEKVLRLLQMFLLNCLKFNIPGHVPGVNNDVADVLSRS